MARRKINVFSLSFLDAMTCGFGAVVLFFMILNATFGKTEGHMTADLHGQVDKLEEEVLEGHRKLVELRNSLRAVESEKVLASGLSRRLIEILTEVREELATYEESTLAKREHVNKLKSDIKTLEDEVKRLSAAAPSNETPGDRIRAFVGEGDRQYLTGLKVGGRRILILVDTSASMLDDTIVNVIRRRNLSDPVKLRSAKWRADGLDRGLAHDPDSSRRELSDLRLLHPGGAHGSRYRRAVARRQQTGAARGLGRSACGARYREGGPVSIRRSGWWRGCAPLPTISISSPTAFPLREGDRRAGRPSRAETG